MYCCCSSSAHYDEPKSSRVKDRKRAENDYKINLKNELIIDDLHKKIELVLENQKKILKELDNKENNKND